MKIVHIITRLIVGGAQENTLLSCAAQQQRGHDVTLLTGPSKGPEGSLVEHTAGGGYRVEVIGPMRRAINPVADWAAYHQLIERLRQIRPDVVHTHSSKAGILGRWAARKAQVPAIIHTIHGLAFTASRWGVVNAAYRTLERKAAPITMRIVCVADAMREQSLAAGIGRREQYVTVYSGMDTTAFLSPQVPREETRQRLGLQPDQVVVGTIARLFDLKGHDDLLALAPDLCRRFPRLVFLWVGDGVLRPRFEQSIAQMGLSERFVLTGLVPPEQIPQFTVAMDILVHPSRREGLARALPQGQLAGCPVVAYDIDGNIEGFLDGQTGLAIRPFEVAAFGQALARLVEDPHLRRSMGERGREFAATRFSAETMVESLERVYAQALGQEGE
jgi:glycosyltransferase involved in cell wall biosynthesis